MANLLWTQKSDIGPAPRTLAAVTYDVVRKKLLLYGGFLGGFKITGDTWQWDGQDWTQVADTGPSARGAAAMTFDAQRERAVLFGGNALESNRFCGDTWEWDGDFWTQVSDTGPGGCTGHQMVYDSERKRVVLFGGVNIDVDHYVGSGKTWEWDGSSWVQQDDTGPAPRNSHAMAYDSERNCVVLFGGVAARKFDLSGQLYGDTWERKAGVWKQERDFGPGASKNAAMVFDGRRTILFGGYSQKNSGATWEWDGKLWTQKQDIGPTPRDSHAMAFDSDRQQVVLFGGYTSGATGMLGDTWELPRA
jgi:N-acetylneuraminic acid mutarotase